MKTKLQLAILSLALSTINHQLATCHAQGSLTPPAGAPVPVMKTLDQVEARTPIASAPYTITNPGSYYLTGNVNVNSGDAITIATNQVTLDLNGFTISSTTSPAAGSGILLANGRRDVTIVNGHIKGGVTNNVSYVYGGPGFSSGISLSGLAPLNIRVVNLSVSGVGTGINLGGNTTTSVEACNVKTVTYDAISADSVKGCSVIDCGGKGISGSTASDCIVENAGSTGMECNQVLNCSSRSRNSYGFFSSSVENSFGGSSTGTGIYAGCVMNSRGFSSSVGGIGLQADIASFSRGGNSAGGTAIKATIANGCIADIGTNSITYKYNMP